MKQIHVLLVAQLNRQPPSGGCELKPRKRQLRAIPPIQPPSGGYELKLEYRAAQRALPPQPPSGGCELKPIAVVITVEMTSPAAFGRL